MRFNGRVVSLFLVTALTVPSVESSSGNPANVGYGGYRPIQNSQTDWHRNNENVQQEQAYPQDYRSSTEPNNESTDGLPDGWSEHFDPNSRQYYYYNSEDGTTTWERPARNYTKFQPNGSDVHDREAEIDPSQTENDFTHNSDTFQMSDNYGQQQSHHDSSVEKNEWSPEDIEAFRHVESEEQQGESTGGTEVFGHTGRTMESTLETPQISRDEMDEDKQSVSGYKDNEMPSPSLHRQTPDPSGPPESRIPRYESPSKESVSVPSREINPSVGKSSSEIRNQEFGGATPNHGQGSSNSSAGTSLPAWGVSKERVQSPLQGNQYNQYSEQNKYSGMSEGFISQGRTQPAPQAPNGQYDSRSSQVPNAPIRSSNETRELPNHQRQSMVSGPPQRFDILREEKDHAGDHSRSTHPMHQGRPGYGLPYSQGRPPIQRDVPRPQYGSPQQYRQFNGAPQSYNNPQQGGGQVSSVLEEGTTAVKDALGKSWQGILGLSSRTREAMEQARDQVVTGASVASQTLSEKGTSFWGQAKSAIGSVFEKNEGTAPTPYSMSNQYNARQQSYSNPQAPGQFQGYQQQQQYPPRYGATPPHNSPPPRPPQDGKHLPPRHYPQAPQQRNDSEFRNGSAPMQPRSSAPYPHQARTRESGPYQAQYDNSGHGRSTGPATPEHGGRQDPRYRQFQPGQGQGNPQPSKRMDHPEPWSHPGLSGDM